MKMIKKIRASITPVIAGIVSGLIVTVYFSINADDNQQTKTVYVPTKSTNYISMDKDTENLARSNQDQLSQLQRQLVELQAQKEIVEQDSLTEPSVDTQKTVTDYNDRNNEAAKSAELAWWDTIKTQFEQEEYDSNWAPTAENNFQQDLSDMANDSNFTLVDTDCRSKSCSVTVEFPTYSKATENFSNLLHHDYKTNCARQTLLPEPDRSLGEAPYQATFIFDCSDNNDQS